jgi:hypothetical protein
LAFLLFGPYQRLAWAFDFQESQTCGGTSFQRTTNATAVARLTFSGLGWGVAMEMDGLLKPHQTFFK